MIPLWLYLWSARSNVKWKYLKLVFVIVIHYCPALRNKRKWRKHVIYCEPSSANKMSDMSCQQIVSLFVHTHCFVFRALSAVNTSKSSPKCFFLHKAIPQKNVLELFMLTVLQVKWNILQHPAVNLLSYLTHYHSACWDASHDSCPRKSLPCQKSLVPNQVSKKWIYCSLLCKKLEHSGNICCGVYIWRTL